MTTTRGILTDGSTLNKGDDVISNSGRFQLVLQQSDGNLVLYDLAAGPPPAKALWSSGTPGRGVETCTLTSGDLVLYDFAGNVIWSSGSSGINNPSLNVQDDGNVVIYQPTAVWTTHT